MIPSWLASAKDAIGSYPLAKEWKPRDEADGLVGSLIFVPIGYNQVIIVGYIRSPRSSLAPGFGR